MNKDIVTIINYGKETKMRRNDAIDFYTYCVKNSEGAEQYRYKTILADLKARYTIAWDRDNWLPKGYHVCPYCSDITTGDEENMLCKGCRETFGHTWYDEL